MRKLFAVIMFAVAIAAQAQSATKQPVDLLTPMVGYDHKPIMTPVAGDAGKTKTLTLLDVVTTSLISQLPALDGEHPDPVSAVKRVRLASYLLDHSKDAELSAEDTALILARVKLAWGAVVVDAAWRSLDAVGYRNTFER